MSRERGVTQLSVGHRQLAINAAIQAKGQLFSAREAGLQIAHGRSRFAEARRQLGEHLPAREAPEEWIAGRAFVELLQRILDPGHPFQ